MKTALMAIAVLAVALLFVGDAAATGKPARVLVVEQVPDFVPAPVPAQVTVINRDVGLFRFRQRTDVIISQAPVHSQALFVPRPAAANVNVFNFGRRFGR